MDPRVSKKRQPATLIVLAGGKSRRMRWNKACLPAPDKPLIQRVIDQAGPLFDEVLISVSRGQKFDFMPYLSVEDAAEGIGPLAGILSGLKAAAHETCVVIACDIPDIDAVFLARMLDEGRGHEIVVPFSGQDKYEPLLAVYKKSVLPKIERLVAAGDFSILSLFPLCRTRFMRMEDASWIRNLNTPKDYDEWMKGRAKGM
jgi:molybdopterin-guanine dinucleotide biosynthesis protein A